MYAQNLTGRAVLITPPEVLRKTGTNNQLDAGKVLPNIELAESRFVRARATLGATFYEALAAEKNRTVTSDNIISLQALFTAQDGSAAPTLEAGMIVNAAEFMSSDNQRLWNMHLWKFLAECVRYVCLAENYVEFTSQGLMKNNPIASALGSETAKSVGASLSDVKFLKDNWLMERIEPLRIQMLEYLTENGSVYTGWNTGDLRTSPARLSAYLDVSIYRDQDERNDAPGCVWRDNNPTRRRPDAGPGLDPEWWQW